MTLFIAGYTVNLLRREKEESLKRLEGNVVNLTALVTLVALFLLIIGGSQSEEDSTTESQPGATKSAGVSDTTTEHDFEPTYIGGYPTEETAAAMFDEYDYQAATQF